MARSATLNRDEIRELLFDDAKRAHRDATDLAPSTQLLTWLGEAVQYVCCELPESYDGRNVFRRAAMLGSLWARGAGRGTQFAPDAMVSLITTFLSYEGAAIAGRRGAVADTAMAEWREKIVREVQSGQMNASDWVRFCNWELYNKLAELCAEYWLAAPGLCDAVNKWCRRLGP